ncbi:MAG: coenzyme F420-0:L-glutamate ligase [Acholeplasmataceae bacterium]
MNNIGTIARGIKTPLIKEGDDLIEIIIDSVLKASKDGNFEIKDNDVLAITESVVSISQGNYVTIDNIKDDIKSKFKTDHIGVLFPMLSRNRFSGILKAIARASKKITIQLSYPFDEVGNGILYIEDLKKLNINPYQDIINELTYQKHFAHFVHPFTKLNMIDYYRNLCEKENVEVEFILSNNPTTILEYTKNIIVSNVHKRNETKKILVNEPHDKVLSLDEIVNDETNKHGFNKTFGLLGSNIATKEKLKLFPSLNDPIVYKIQKKIKEITKKDIHVMIYGDGAFKDPVSGIWELADPLVSPSFTKGLLGSPSEIKLKYLIDNNKNLTNEELKDLIEKEIANKSSHDTDDKKLGTTPRMYVDLLGSLSDLISGSGEKGTPIVYIENYFSSYSD